MPRSEDMSLPSQSTGARTPAEPNGATADTGAAVPDGDTLTIAGRTLRSRLLLGTGGFPSLELLAGAIAASGSELVTVALRRIGGAGAESPAR